MIFAAGLLAGGLGFMTQIGFIIGFGILLDTFLVRTVVVPAIATVLGRYSWWPSTVRQACVSAAAHDLRSKAVITEAAIYKLIPGAAT